MSNNKKKLQTTGAHTRGGCTGVAVNGRVTSVSCFAPELVRLICSLCRGYGGGSCDLDTSWRDRSR